MWRVLPLGALYGSALTFGRPLASSAFNYAKDLNWTNFKPRRGSGRSVQLRRKMDYTMSTPNSRKRKYGGGSSVPVFYGAAERTHFKGRFRGPKVGKMLSTKHTKFGITTHREYAFEPDMNDVLYVGASSFNTTEIIGNVGCAFIRRLFLHNTICRQQFQDFDEEIKHYSGNVWQWEFKFRSVHNDSETVYGTQAPTAPFTNWFTTATTFRTAGLQLAAAIEHEWFQSKLLYQVALVAVSTGPVQQVAHNVIDVSDWLYHMYSCVNMKIQNTTPANDGATLQETDITSNPLQGCLYRFSGITPKVSDWNVKALNWGVVLEDQDASNNGTIYPGTGDPPGDGWNTVPKPQMFKNCVGAIKVLLEPGDIKYHSLKFKYHGTMQKLLLGMYGAQESAIVGARDPDTQMFGTSFVIALEKVMRTGDAAVKAGAQLEVSCGCYVQPKYKLYSNTEVIIGDDGAPALPTYPA